MEECDIPGTFSNLGCIQHHCSPAGSQALRHLYDTLAALVQQF
jgi:hypothetical protein